MRISRACAPHPRRSMISRNNPHNEKRTPVQVVRFPRKARRAGDALTTSYITSPSEGELRVSGGRHSLTDIARHFPPRPRETRPVVATPRRRDEQPKERLRVVMADLGTPESRGRKACADATATPFAEGVRNPRADIRVMALGGSAP